MMVTPHKGLGYDGRKENTMDTNITIVEEKHMEEFEFS